MLLHSHPQATWVGRVCAAACMLLSALSYWSVSMSCRANPPSVYRQVSERPIAGDPLSTDSGLVSGKLLESGVRAYLGIPFAAPPVGALRWREPQPVPKWSGVLAADRSAP